jgi:hypothetical protein
MSALKVARGELSVQESFKSTVMSPLDHLVNQRDNSLLIATYVPNNRKGFKWKLSEKCTRRPFWDTKFKLLSPKSNGD